MARSRCAGAGTEARSAGPSSGRIRPTQSAAASGSQTTMCSQIGQAYVTSTTRAAITTTAPASSVMKATGPSPLSCSRRSAPQDLAVLDHLEEAREQTAPTAGGTAAGKTGGDGGRLSMSPRPGAGPYCTASEIQERLPPHQ